MTLMTDHIIFFLIAPNGSWTMYLLSDSLEKSYKFSVETFENGGIFRKFLGPYHFVTIDNISGFMYWHNYCSESTDKY